MLAAGNDWTAHVKIVMSLFSTPLMCFWSLPNVKIGCVDPTGSVIVVKNSSFNFTRKINMKNLKSF
jgi:hypothetical protein